MSSARRPLWQSAQLLLEARVPELGLPLNAGDVELKIMISNAAQKRKKLLSLDIGNAYPKARRSRPVSYLALGK